MESGVLQMRGKKLALLIFCGVMAAGVSLYAAAQGMAVPKPDLSKCGFETQADYEVSGELKFPEEVVLPYYRMEEASLEELREQAADCFGEAAVGRSGALELSPQTGGWTYREDMDSPAYFTAPENLPSEEEAARVAGRFLEGHGLFSGELGEPDFGFSSSGLPVEGKDTVLRRSVTFRPTVDERQVYGGYTLRLTVGDNGEVTEADKQAGPLAAAGEVRLRTGEDALRELRGNPGRFPVSLLGLESGKITGCELAYYADRDTGFVTPVYVFHGEGQCLAEEKEQAFSILVDAVKR